jgi:predicted small metal-binding protein
MTLDQPNRCDTGPRVAARRWQLSQLFSRFKWSMIMFRYGCRDLGVDCDYVVTDTTFLEVKEKVFAHAGVVHADMLKGMTQEELALLTTAVEGAIKMI